MIKNLCEKFVRWIIFTPEYKIVVYVGVFFLAGVFVIVSGENLTHDTPSYMKRPLLEVNHFDYPVEGKHVKASCGYNDQTVVYENIDWIGPSEVSVKGKRYPITLDTCVVSEM